jgi:hypothetical protein
LPLLPTIAIVVAFAVVVVVLGPLGAADVFVLPLPPLHADIAVTTQTALTIVRTRTLTCICSRLLLLQK